jgi:hypothetical protein
MSLKFYWFQWVGQEKNKVVSLSGAGQDRWEQNILQEVINGNLR